MLEVISHLKHAEESLFKYIHYYEKNKNHKVKYKGRVYSVILLKRMKELCNTIEILKNESILIKSELYNRKNIILFLKIVLIKI